MNRYLKQICGQGKVLLEQYQAEGYAIIKGLFTPTQLNTVQTVLSIFHRNWQKANQAFYQQHAINSAYLTAKQHLNDEQRLMLFEFICSDKLVAIAEKVIKNPAFLNTQLFFDPANSEKNNYWHRDIQYDFSHRQQKAMLESGPSMPHFRIPLTSEKGVEVIPGSHKRWDTPKELEVRIEANGKHSYDDLPNSRILEVERGDLLIFSAKMLHRGVYGNNRFALDILLVDDDSANLRSVSQDCLPDRKMFERLANPIVFERAMKARRTKD
ncbi:phytanoyl-CoA dioxygenase family protein [Thalassotalea sp. ND16A]|uniref:phytanoyl-CoA dioxygenase family protein n=1 Tax=Thalassotalea sp. ND16A TaxID=1535422 RepID=UPI00051D9AAD|nr:phytanoyl-CoA dioxygenase family protein [Thalassotalea sp. ND16A]KGK01598.1 hypothetical protein ND16A_2947 [Thalassotalea sp. ND16A]